MAVAAFAERYVVDLALGLKAAVMLLNPALCEIRFIISRPIGTAYRKRKRRPEAHGLPGRRVLSQWGTVFELAHRQNDLLACVPGAGRLLGFAFHG
jgi:hypothetical protein